MTRFRYEAILHVGHDDGIVLDGEFLDWTKNKWGLGEIRSVLRQRRDQPFGIRSIKNARIGKDFAAIAILSSVDAGLTAGDLRHRLDETADEGIPPQELLDLENEDLGYAVFLSWSACRRDGSYDAFFVPAESLHQTSCPAIDWPEAEASTSVSLVNAPGQQKLRLELANQLMDLCSKNLSAEAVPGEIVLVDSLPRNLDGEVEYPALTAAMAATNWL